MKLEIATEPAVVALITVSAIWGVTAIAKQAVEKHPWVVGIALPLIGGLAFAGARIGARKPETPSHGGGSRGGSSRSSGGRRAGPP